MQGINPIFFSLKKDSEGYYFLDRSPAIFTVLLEYLRNGKLHYDQNISESQLRLEFKYFHCPFPELNPVVAEVRADAERYVSSCWSGIQEIINNKITEMLNGQPINVPVGWSHPSIPVPNSKHAITAYFWHCVATYITTEHGYVVRMKSNGGYTNVLVLYLPVTTHHTARANNNLNQIESYNIFERDEESLAGKPKVCSFADFQPGRQFLHLRSSTPIADGKKKQHHANGTTTR